MVMVAGLFGVFYSNYKLHVLVEDKAMILICEDNKIIHLVVRK